MAINLTKLLVKTLVDKICAPFIMDVFCSVRFLRRYDTVIWVPSVSARRIYLEKCSLMKIYVSQISEDEGLDIHHAFAEREPKLRGRDGQILGRSVIDARATRSGDQLRLTGTVVATVQLDCARCLAPVPVNVDESFDLFYIPSVNRLGPGEERELAKDDLLVAFYREIGRAHV